MIDLHCHLLAGVDDGPADADAAAALARAMLASGTTAAAATPHIDETYGLSPTLVAGLVDALNADLRRRGIALTVHRGGELALERAVGLGRDELEAIRLGDGPFVLLEPPLTGTLPDLRPLLARMRRQGLRTLLAHPERCPALQRAPQRVAELVQAGALVQVTAGAFAGDFGRIPRRAALELARRELIHVLASDAHDPHRRPPGAQRGLAALDRRVSGAAGLGDWLCEEVPAAILAGAAIPPRPPPARAGPRPWRRRVRARLGSLLGDGQGNAAPDGEDKDLRAGA